jgi:hypothetical protein
MIGRLWERMTALYGSRWGIEYGPALSADGGLAPVAHIWADSLADVLPDRIAAALRVCTDERASEHPPTLPEFLRLCRATAKKPSTAVPAIRLDPTVYADSPRARCEALAAQLAENGRRDLDNRLKRAATDRQRESMAKAYWMSQIGALDVGKALAKAWQQPAEEAA